MHRILWPVYCQLLNRFNPSISGEKPLFARKVTHYPITCCRFFLIGCLSFFSSLRLESYWCQPGLPFDADRDFSLAWNSRSVKVITHTENAIPTTVWASYYPPYLLIHMCHFNSIYSTAFCRNKWGKLSAHNNATTS